MECSICETGFNAMRQPQCPRCIQISLYSPRVQQALALLEREKQHTYAEAVLRPGNDGVIAALPQDADWDAITVWVKKHGWIKTQEELEIISARILAVTEQAAQLRQQIDDYKDHVARQKSIYARRKQELTHERKELEKQRSRLLDPMHAALRKTHQRLEKVHMRTTEARTLLCQEAARLSGLKKSKSRDGRSQYLLGGVPLPDLRALNGKVEFGTSESGEKLGQAHEVASAAMENICRLLGNCCHYLSVRLPSEILLPTNSFPYAALLPERVSYKMKDLQYLDVLSSRQSSPSASRLLDRNKAQSSRPRILHLHRPLHELFKEDTKAFGLYIEGIMLLAWDVAWLCRSQGIDTLNSFDDVCAIGKNLYQLFLSPEVLRPLHDRKPSSTPSKNERPTNTATATDFRFGAFSHGSSYNSLVSPPGLLRMEKWRLASSARIVDKLKSYYQNEISGAEWDFISGGEWDEAVDHDPPVFVGGTPQKLLDKTETAMSVMTLKPSDDADDGTMDDGKRKGSNGWMKVRGRGVNE